MEFEHEVALAETGVSYDQLPVKIKNKINRFNQEKAKIYADPENVDQEKALYLKKSSLVIAEDIQDFVESQYPEEENQNQNNMSKPNAELAARAKAVGLAETATEAEIVAKEKELGDKKAADDKKAEEEKNKKKPVYEDNLGLGSDLDL
jgi:hypothetical protein